ADPGGRADEHHDGEQQLIATHRSETRPGQKWPVLHVALAPTKIAANEFDQCGRILLPSEILFRQHTHYVAGTAHQYGFQLIVAEDVTSIHSVLGKRRQLAMRGEGRKPNDGVVTPIGSAISLPPGTADRVAAHAQPHTELEDTRKYARRR